MGQFEPPNVGHIEPMFNVPHLEKKTEVALLSDTVVKLCKNTF